jgi:hypothetical protein
MKFKSVLFTASLFLVLMTGVESYANAPVNVSVYRPTGDCFESFNLHRQGTGTAMSWKATGNITSFTIQQSYDGVYFYTIDQVAPEASGWNRYRHEAALPGYNYYRIAANMADGTVEYSGVEVVRIVSRK